jgi:hypothetical protein
VPSLHQFVNPPSKSGRGQFPSIMRGAITNVSTASQVWVAIPSLGGDPLQAVNTVPGDLQIGDAVILGVADGRADNIVVLSKEQPTVPAHKHPETDIAHTGWQDLALLNGWAAGPDAGTYPGLRYRTDARFLHLHGQITGATTGEVAALPITLAHDSFIPAMNPSGTWRRLRITRAGKITAAIAETMYVNASAPLT